MGYNPGMAKTAQISLRLAPDRLDMIKAAAATEDRTVTDFVCRAAVAAARVAVAGDAGGVSR